MDREKRSTDRRLGFTRFFVPDAAFRWYIRGVGLGALGIGAFFGSLSWWYQRRLLDSFGLLEAMGNADLEQAVSEHSFYLIVITGIASVGTILFVTLLSLYLLHRITGPIYRLKQHLLGMMMGRPPTELRFRKDDQLADLCETVNEFLRHQGILEGRSQAASDPKAAAEAAERLHARAEA